MSIVHRRVGLFVLALFAIMVLVGTFPQARARNANAPQPFISPTVCTTAGVCFEVDNNGHGIAVEGQALNQNAVGVRGLAPNTSKRGIGISGQAFGPSSVAINGVAFSTDASHASQGVIGISANGGGVEGTTTFNSTLALTAASGVLGKDRSTAFGFDTGVEGTSTRGVGVAGVSQNGNAVTGSSSNANGVVGQTSFFATSGQGHAGVLGQDLATPGPLGTPTVNAGVLGTSSFGTAVSGISANGTGVSAFSNAGTALTVQSNSGSGFVVQTNSTDQAGVITNQIGQGLFVGSGNNEALVVSSGANSGDAVRFSGGNNLTTLQIENGATGISVSAKQGVVAVGSQGPAIVAIGGLDPSAPALLVETATGNGAPLMIAIGAESSDVMSLDQDGNMILAGTLTQNGTPLVAHRSRNGWGVGTYAAQETSKTIEDVGEAQLEGGQTYISLDPKFGALMNKQSTYLVFLTPQGDCHGLYAAQKGPAGFYVRELGGGRSSIAFDYRIVARPIDSDGVRLPVVRPIPTYHAPSHPSLHRAVKMSPFRPTATKIRPGYVPSNIHRKLT